MNILSLQAVWFVANTELVVSKIAMPDQNALHHPPVPTSDAKKKST